METEERAEWSNFIILYATNREPRIINILMLSNAHPDPDWCNFKHVCAVRPACQFITIV